MGRGDQESGLCHLQDADGEDDHQENLGRIPGRQSQYEILRGFGQSITG